MVNEIMGIKIGTRLISFKIKDRAPTSALGTGGKGAGAPPPHLIPDLRLDKQRQEAEGLPPAEAALW